MSHIDTGTYGAKVQSWRKANPRDLLKSLIDETQLVDKKEILRIFRDKVMNADDEYLESIIEYWFSNNYHSLVESKPVNLAIARSAKAKRSAAFKEKIIKGIENQAKIILLDMVLPNGKSLRSSTGKECSKIGGWLSKVASKVKPNDVIGNVLTEKQLQKLYSR